MAVAFDPWSGVYRAEREPDRFQEVGEDYPSPAVKAAAERVLRDSVADLELPADTRIRWCTTESASSRQLRARYNETPWRTVELAQRARGLVEPANPTVLWVLADQTPDVAANTTKHECRHAWQLDPAARRWELPDLETMEQREADAAAYAASASPVAARPAPAAARARPALAYHPAKRPVPPVRTAAPAARSPFQVTRKSRVVDGHKEFECEQCEQWMRVGVTHRCPVGYGRMADRRLAAGGPNAASPKYARVPYTVKAV